MSKRFGMISKILGKKSKSDHIRTESSRQKASPHYEITPEIREILNLVDSEGAKVIFVTGPAGAGCTSSGDSGLQTA